MVLSAAVGAAAMLLIVAGLAKLRTPDPAAAMLRGFWPRLRGRAYARTAGVVEVAAGSLALATGNCLALTVCYLALLVVAVRLATLPQRAACGCFGSADGEVGVAHLVLDTAGLAVAAWGVLASAGSVATLFDGSALTGVAAAAQAVLLAALGYLSITALPALNSARRSVEAAR